MWGDAMNDSNSFIEFLSILFNLGAVFCGFIIIHGFLHSGEDSSPEHQNQGFFTAHRERDRTAMPMPDRTSSRSRHRISRPALRPVTRINKEMKSLEQGEEGEYLIFESLDRLDGNNRILVNLYLPQKDGATTEVDLVMINSKGVHVFESKNYSGWIFGNETNKYWTQVLMGGKKNRFYNPIWQNEGHIRAIRNLYPGLSKSDCFSYIIFSDRCGLKELHVKSPDVFIGYRYELTRLFNSVVSKNPDRLTDSQVTEIFGFFSRYIHADTETREKHIRQLEEKSKK
jgi:hypothetical protein